MPSIVEQIPNFGLKTVFLGHFILISLNCNGYWAGNAFLFYNSIYIFLLLWSIFNRELVEPLQLAIVVNGTALFLDIILLVMHFPGYLGAILAVLHLLVRPITLVVLIKTLEARGGNTRNIFNETRAESYEDLDRTAPAQPAGYSISTAQPI